MRSDTSPSVHTPAGMLRHAGRLASFATLTLTAEVERGGQVACARTHAGQCLEIEAACDELQDRGRIVGRVIDVAAPRERRNDDRRDTRARTPFIALGRR